MLCDNTLSLNINIFYCWFQIWLTENTINHNFQQHECFHKCQKLAWTLQFIQDVITWWDFTYCMTIQTLYFQSAVNKWIDDCDRSKLKLLKLCAEKWKHVEYIIVFLYFFFDLLELFLNSQILQFIKCEQSTIIFFSIWRIDILKLSTSLCERMICKLSLKMHRTSLTSIINKQNMLEKSFMQSLLF